MSETLIQKTLRGLKWNYIYMIINVVAQIITTSVLARILSPNDYGLIAMANVILGFGSYFAQMGIGPAIIQKKDLSDKDIVSAYFVAFTSSLFFTFVIIMLAPLAKLLFNDIGIVKILRVMSISFIFQSISMVSISILRKEFKFFLLGAINFISFVTGSMCVGIILALLGFGVWSLVISTILQSFVLLILTSFYVRGYLKAVKPNLLSARELLNYGGKYSLSNFIEYLTYRSDAIIIGHFFSPSLLGIYNRGYLLVQLPSQFISANLINVLFPTLNEVRLDKERFFKYYGTLIKLLGFVLFGACIFIAINAKEIVLIILGPKWTESINVLRILSLAIPFHLLINYQGLVYDVYNFLNIKLIIKGLHFAVIVLMYFIFLKYGIDGIAFGFLITEILLYFVYTAFSIKKLKLKISEMIILHKPFIFISLVIGIPALLINIVISSLSVNLIILFCLEIMIVTIVAVLFILYFPSKELKEMAREFNIKRKIDDNGNKRNPMNNLINNFLRKVAA